MDDAVVGKRIGWIGAGRMGFAMAGRLCEAGCDVAVWNRTRSKAEPLADKGAVIVDEIQELADCDIVFTIVAGPDDFIEVTTGANGLLSRGDACPRIICDLTTISEQASRTVRAAALEKGCHLVDAPVSGNAKVVAAGRLSIVASGDAGAFAELEPYLDTIAGNGVSYVGEGSLARLVKICHNVLLGVVAQNLAEVTVLAEKGGVPRHAFLDFINKSVMGSMFTRYKTPAYVNLDMTPTFTPELLKKDMDLGLAAARELGVAMPVSAAAREIVQSLIGHGYADCDFAALLELEAKASALDIESEDMDVRTGLDADGTRR